MTSDDFIFESFLPYRHALHLCRALTGLLTLSIRLRSSNSVVEESLAGRVSFSVRALFPSIKPPDLTDAQFKNLLEEEDRAARRTAAETEAEMERMAGEIRERIDSGEFDMWDDSPRFIDAREVENFCRIARSRVREQIVGNSRPGSSFISELAEGAISAMERGDEATMRGLRAVLVIWDYARMHHEGEPPYRVVFSGQVAEALGIDPVLESARIGELGEPSPSDIRRMRAALRVIRRFLPVKMGEARDALRLAGIAIQ